MPEFGEGSPEIVILHVDSQTQATQLMIRVPKNTHVPKHWHTSNETHTVISGTFIIECEGKREELGPGLQLHAQKNGPRGWTSRTKEHLLIVRSMSTNYGLRFLACRIDRARGNNFRFLAQACRAPTVRRRTLSWSFVSRGSLRRLS
jgi:quercetin dioxygenase-like cupin family protein